MNTAAFEIFDMDKNTNDYDMVYFKDLSSKEFLDNLELMSKALRCCFKSIKDGFSKDGSSFLVRVLDSENQSIKNYRFFTVYQGDCNG
mgnify:CR=1 FL=1